MVSYENRQKLKGKLPKSVSHGYDLIKAKLPSLTRKQIERAFNTKTDMYYNEDVITAALQVVKEAKEKSNGLEAEIEKI
ncbi:hypothetical protein [Pedobacter sp.]